MSLSKEVYKLIQYTNAVDEMKSVLYSKLIELKTQFPIYLKGFNKQCVINNVKIKETEYGKWFIVEIINEFGNIDYLKIPENLTKLKSIEYEHMRQSILTCKDIDAIQELINSKNSIVNLYPKRVKKDKELKNFIKQYSN